MVSQATTINKAAEIARISRIFDFILLLPILLVIIGSYHLTMILTVGDWDFWLDWKDRQWWPIVTPLMGITFPAAIQYGLWKHLRLPIGATVCTVCLLLGMAITRWFSYHLWTNYPINLVLPATLIPGALLLDFVLLTSRSFFVTAILGGMLFAAVFYPANWAIFAPFHQPVEYNGSLMTLADVSGYSYIRPGVPEYLRIIERGVLRTYDTYATPLSAFCAAVLAVPLYGIWSYIGKLCSTTRFIDKF
jgi:methane/ammonia monooxygenase subunit A